jgi:hypothetical protein
MKVTAALGEVKDILNAFLNHVLQHPGNAYISGYELALRHSNDTWVFEIA